MQYKNIKNNGVTFLHRLSCNLKKGSIKIHLIVDDDVSYHSHPWDFKSIILFGGYMEYSYEDVSCLGITQKIFGWLAINKKPMNVYHKVVLRRLFGRKVPTLTVGIYGEKKQLCSLCQELGYCKSKKQRGEKNQTGV